MKFKHSINIHAHSKKGKATSFLFMVVSVDGKRKELPLAISVPNDAYDKQSRSIHSVPGYASAALDNLHLQELMGKMQKVLAQYELGDSVPTLFDVVDSYNQLVSGNDTNGNTMLTVRQAFDLYLKEASLTEGWTYGTTKHKRCAGNNLCDVLGKRYINNLNDSSLTDLLSHYMDSMRANTLEKFISDIRVFLRWCSRKGIYQGASHDTFKPVIKGANDAKEIIYLTSEELQLLRDHKWKINERHLERTVDAFLFACFSGLRHSDVYNLRRSAIHDGAIHIRVIKTGALLAIPLNNHTQRILDKYADYDDSHHHPFPVISDQKCNTYIKEACHLCGIDTLTTISYHQGGKRVEQTFEKYKLVSFHCARRTFITQAFSLGVPAEVIITFTAHSSTKQLRPYLAISEQQKRDKMSLFNTL